MQQIKALRQTLRDLGLKGRIKMVIELNEAMNQKGRKRELFLAKARELGIPDVAQVWTEYRLNLAECCL